MLWRCQLAHKRVKESNTRIHQYCALYFTSLLPGAKVKYLTGASAEFPHLGPCARAHWVEVRNLAAWVENFGELVILHFDSVHSTHALRF